MAEEHKRLPQKRMINYVDPTPHYSDKELDGFVEQAKVNERKRLLQEFYGIPQNITKIELRERIEKLLRDE